MILFSSVCDIQIAPCLLFVSYYYSGEGSLRPAQSEPQLSLCWATLDLLVSLRESWVQAVTGETQQPCSNTGVFRDPGLCYQMLPEFPCPQKLSGCFLPQDFSAYTFPALSLNSPRFWFCLLLDDPKIARR